MASTLDPCDLFDIRSQLSDEERMVFVARCLQHFGLVPSQAPTASGEPLGDYGGKHGGHAPI